MITGFILLGMVSFAEAQEPIKGDSLQEVVVTGTGTHHLLRTAPVQTEVITRRDLEQYGGRSIEEILDNEFSKYVKGNNGMAFLGHGNPANMNYGNGNQRYFDLEAALQKKNPNYFVATVDQEDNLLDELFERMQDQGKVTTGATLTLHALMCIAGDHAHNDMSGIEKEGDSWREFFVEKGFKCQYDGNDANTSNNCILKGLGDYAAIRAIWKQHTKDAEEMFAEEEEE